METRQKQPSREKVEFSRAKKRMNAASREESITVIGRKKSVEELKNINIYPSSSDTGTIISGAFDQTWQSQQSDQLTYQGDMGTALPAGTTKHKPSMTWLS